MDVIPLSMLVLKLIRDSFESGTYVNYLNS